MLTEVGAVYLSSVSSVKKFEQLISIFEKHRPTANWNELRRINFQKASHEIAQWLTKVFPEVLLKDEVRGLLFGIETPSKNGMPFTYDMELACFSDFSDDDIDWADEENYVFRPSMANPQSVAYQEFFDLVHEQSSTERPYFELVFGIGFSAFLLENGFREIERKSLNREIGSAVCWSGGEIHVLGRISASGFKKPAKFEGLM